MAKKPAASESHDEHGKAPAVTSPSASSGPESTQNPEVPPLSELFTLDPAAGDNQIQSIVNRHIAFVASRAAAVADFNVLVLYDGHSLDRSDANRIYRALSGVDRARSILLVLRSPGGDIAAAYFIGKLCREHTRRFEVVVPREAKSAATLVCCGADVIHMGSLSELGPIDPQFGGMPALAVKHSLEHLAEIVSKHPGAKEMLSDYLSKALPVNIVGHFERAAGSAAQYAEKLLSNRVKSHGPALNGEIAKRLVYEYKDHGFAIDAREATTIFGEEMVKTNSLEYDAGNEIYEQLDLIEFIVGRRFSRELAFTGGASDGCWVFAPRETSTSV